MPECNVALPANRAQTNATALQNQNQGVEGHATLLDQLHFHYLMWFRSPISDQQEGKK